MRKPIPCDVCGADLARNGRGFVRWWERRSPEGGEAYVAAFDVICAGACSARNRAQRAGEIGGSTGQRDMQLDRITGERALTELVRLLRAYRWTDRDALERCLNVFERAAGAS